MALNWSGEREFTEPEHARRMLASVPLIPIGELAESTFARVRGKVLPMREIGVLIAPVSGRSCVVYLIHIEGSYGSHTQHFGERRGAPFVLIQDGQRAVIDPAHALLRVRYEKVSTRASIRACSQPEVDLLRRLGIPPAGADGREASFVFQEARIEPGQLVTACGAGVREPDPQAPPGELYRGVPLTRIAISGTMAAPIAASNDPDLL